MTLYVLQGFARGAEFGVEPPLAGWRRLAILHDHFGTIYESLNEKTLRCPLSRLELPDVELWRRV